MSITVACRRLTLATRRLSLKTLLPMKISKQYCPSIQHVLALDLKNYSNNSQHSLKKKWKPETKHKRQPPDLLKESPLLLEQLEKSEIDFKILPDLCENILKEENVIAGNVGKLCQSVCARYIHMEKKVDQAIQMFSYLKTHTPDETQPAAYAILIGSFRGTGGQHEKVILEIWEKLKEFSDMFPSTLLSYISQGLCETSRWKEALDLIKMEKVLSSNTSIPMWKPILIRAIKEGDADIAGYLLNNMILDFNLGSRYQINLLIHDLFQLVKDDQVEFNLKDFCDVLEIMRSQPVKSLAEDIFNHFKEEMPQWNCVSTGVKNGKYCLSCGYRLPEAKICQTEIDGLKDQILNKLILKSNVYLNTNPNEVKQFLKMVEREGPFDVVIDGCNIGIGHHKGESIMSAVDYFKRNNIKKVLVIGRDHMLKWKHMNVVQDNAIFFPVNNISKDDPFILYAACQSPDTYFLSGDHYSNMVHSDIDKEYYQIFCKWLYHRQIKHFKFVNQASVRLPMQTDIVPSYNNMMYHIPYTNDEDEKIYWLCATKKS